MLTPFNGDHTMKRKEKHNTEPTADTEALLSLMGDEAIEILESQSNELHDELLNEDADKYLR